MQFVLPNNVSANPTTSCFVFLKGILLVVCQGDIYPIDRTVHNYNGKAWSQLLQISSQQIELMLPDLYPLDSHLFVPLVSMSNLRFLVKIKLLCVHGILFDNNFVACFIFRIYPYLIVFPDVFHWLYCLYFVVLTGLSRH